MEPSVVASVFDTNLFGAIGAISPPVPSPFAFTVEIPHVVRKVERIWFDSPYAPTIPYIEYTIIITNTIDGSTYVTHKRYSELKKLHRELEKAGLATGISFPKSHRFAEERLMLETTEENSDFVKTRQRELCVYLQTLINSNPNMVTQPLVAAALRILPTQTHIHTYTNAPALPPTFKQTSYESFPNPNPPRTPVNSGVFPSVNPNPNPNPNPSSTNTVAQAAAPATYNSDLVDV